jgi:hypothetical protein
MSELRKRSRVAAQFEAALTVGTDTFPVVTRNISLKGILCDPDPRAHAEATCQLTLTLSPQVKVAIQARIVRNEETGLAIDFVGMDEESFFHLRNIVRFGADDADSIDQEMTVPAFSPE